MSSQPTAATPISGAMSAMSRSPVLETLNPKLVEPLPATIVSGRPDRPLLSGRRSARRPRCRPRRRTVGVVLALSLGLGRGGRAALVGDRVALLVVRRGFVGGGAALLGVPRGGLLRERIRFARRPSRFRRRRGCSPRCSPGWSPPGEESVRPRRKDLLVEVLGRPPVANATGAESRTSGDMAAVAAAVTMARRSFMKTSGSQVHRRLRYASEGEASAVGRGSGRWFQWFDLRTL
ncbi:hypothetical protein SHIRM173S_11371 [Streptomyces hirsutus]